MRIHERERAARHGAAWRMPRLALAAALAASTVLAGGQLGRLSPVRAAAAPVGTRAALAAYARQSLRFEPNLGQAAPGVRFLARGLHYAISLTPEALRLDLAGQDRTSLSLILQGANPATSLEVRQPLPSKSNYLLGRDPRGWHTGVPNYAQVRYRNVYPGIDLLVHGTQGRLEYDFALAPGADPAAIALRPEGARHLALDRQGNLRLDLPGGTLVQQVPQVFQQGPRGRLPVAGRFVLGRDGTVRFALGRYDRSRALTIDPPITYISYLGGPSEDSATSVATDGQGNIFVAGYTLTSLRAPQPQVPTGKAPGFGFPIKGGVQSTPGGGYDAFVGKFNPAGNGAADQLYTTYLGGSGDDFAGTDQPFASNTDALDGTDLSGNGLAVDGAGDAFVTGFTSSPNFPLAGAFQSMLNSPDSAFVSELNPAGSALLYSTYLGGDQFDFATAIAVHGGNIYVTGCTGPGGTGLPQPDTAPADQHTQPRQQQAAQQVTPREGPSGTFPVTNGTGVNVDAIANVFVTELNPAKGTSGLVYSTVLGGSVDDCGQGIAVDGVGNIDVVGTTESSDFPTTANALSQTFTSDSSDFNPFERDSVFNDRGGCDAFVLQINPSTPAAALSTQLAYSTFVEAHGDPSVMGHGVAVDRAGNIYAVGTVEADNGGSFPTTPGAFQTTYTGHHDRSEAWVSVINPAQGTLLYSTLYGTPLDGFTGSDPRGNDEDTTGNAIALDAAGNIYITGFTPSDIQTTPGALVPYLGAPHNIVNYGAYVAELLPNLKASPSQQLLYGSYLSGSGNDYPYAIAVDGNGFVYLAGGAFPATPGVAPKPLPVTPNPGAFQTTFGGGTEDGFFAALLPNSQPVPFCKVVAAVVGQSPAGPITRLGLVATCNNSSPVTYLSYQTAISPTSGAPSSASFLIRGPLTLSCVRCGLGTEVITASGTIGRVRGKGFSVGAPATAIITFNPQLLPGGALLAAGATGTLLYTLPAPAGVPSPSAEVKTGSYDVTQTLLTTGTTIATAPR